MAGFWPPDDSSAIAILPVAKPVGTAGYFTDGSLTTPATIVDQDFLNGIVVEIQNLSNAGGIPLSKTTPTVVPNILALIASQLTGFVRKIGDTMTGNLTLGTNYGGNSATPSLIVQSGASTVNTVVAAPAATINTVTQAGDSLIWFTDGSQNTGALTIAPWGTGTTGGLRMDSTGQITFNRPFTASSNTTVGGNASVGGTLGVTGAATLASTLSAAGTTVTTLHATGASTLSTTLNVTGATALASTLNVTGAAAFGSSLSAAGMSCTTLNASSAIAATGAITSTGGQVAGVTVASISGNITANSGRFRASFGALGSGDANACPILNDFASSNGNPGWCQLPNGLILQFGSIGAVANGGPNLASFARTWPNGIPIAITISYLCHNNPVNGSIGADFSGAANGQFSYQNTNPLGGTQGCYYWAIGW